MPHPPCTVHCSHTHVHYHVGIRETMVVAAVRVQVKHAYHFVMFHLELAFAGPEELWVDALPFVMESLPPDCEVGLIGVYGLEFLMLGPEELWWMHCHL